MLKYKREGATVLAQEILDGSMLGDGSIYRWRNGSSYRINLSKPLVPRKDYTELARLNSLQEHLKYERWIVDNALAPLGVPIVKGCPKILNSTYKGQLYKYAYLDTQQSPLLIDMYDEWYIGGEWVVPSYGKSYIRRATKRLPPRIMGAKVISLATLAHWFIEDGGSYWLSAIRPRITFATPGFGEQEVYHLIDILNNMGVETIKPSKYKNIKAGSGLVIALSNIGYNIDHFMDLVEPYMNEIFGDSVGPSYKNMIKRRRTWADLLV